jgi:hypothetical protein
MIKNGVCLQCQPDVRVCLCVSVLFKGTEYMALLYAFIFGDNDLKSDCLLW